MDCSRIVDLVVYAALGFMIGHFLIPLIFR